jgi:hypothetical protein
MGILGYDLCTMYHAVYIGMSFDVLGFYLNKNIKQNCNTMAYSSTIATNLIGAARTPDFQCNHVVNEVLTGSKHGRVAAEYLNYGKVIDIPVDGAVVVGKDGKHVGIFISSTEFIHSSSSKMKVVRASLSQLPYVFPLGYEFRME